MRALLCGVIALSYLCCTAGHSEESLAAAAIAGSTAETQSRRKDASIGSINSAESTSKKERKEEKHNETAEHSTTTPTAHPTTTTKSLSTKPAPTTPPAPSQVVIPTQTPTTTPGPTVTVVQTTTPPKPTITIIQPTKDPNAPTVIVDDAAKPTTPAPTLKIKEEEKEEEEPSVPPPSKKDIEKMAKQLEGNTIGSKESLGEKKDDDDDDDDDDDKKEDTQDGGVYFTNKRPELPNLSDRHADKTTSVFRREKEEPTDPVLGDSYPIVIKGSKKDSSESIQQGKALIDSDDPMKRAVSTAAKISSPLSTTRATFLEASHQTSTRIAQLIAALKVIHAHAQKKRNLRLDPSSF